MVYWGQVDYTISPLFLPLNFGTLCFFFWSFVSTHQPSSSHSPVIYSLLLFDFLFGLYVYVPPVLVQRMASACTRLEYEDS